MNLDITMKGHFLNLYHMAISDSEIDTAELEMLYRIGEEKGVSKDEIDAVVIRPDIIKFSVPQDVFEKIGCLFDFARIALADGKVDENEERVMNMFCLKFGFEKENIPTIIQFLLDEAQKETPRTEVLKIVSANL